MELYIHPALVYGAKLLHTPPVRLESQKCGLPSLAVTGCAGSHLLVFYGVLYILDAFLPSVLDRTVQRYGKGRVIRTPYLGTAGNVITFRGRIIPNIPLNIL